MTPRPSGRASDRDDARDVDDAIDAARATASTDDGADRDGARAGDGGRAGGRGRRSRSSDARTRPTVTPQVSSQDATRFGTTPTGRTGSASGTFAATATTSARMVVFGGRELATGRDANDVWEYDLRWNASAGIYDGMWTRLHEGGSGGGAKPRGRSGASACALRGNLYVFGGYGGGAGDFDDLWVFNRAAGAVERDFPGGRDETAEAKRGGDGDAARGTGRGVSRVRRERYE